MPHEKSLADQMYAAFCTQGWIIPQTEEDVWRLERDIAEHSIPAPPELPDPSALIRKLFPATQELNTG